MKDDANKIQQKGRPITIRLQDQVEDESRRLIQNNYLNRATETTEDCFVSPAVITVKKDNLVKMALVSRKSNEKQEKT